MNAQTLSGMIGLEIHVYIPTTEKLFCACKASREKGLQPNVYICPICTAQPGAKPMLPNGAAVEKAVQIALMLGCSVNPHLVWQRKHYNWPDLPKGYQNTLSGAHAFPVGVKGKFHGINISSMHLEEDPAAWNPSTGEVDYNRSGLPLAEIVTAPDFSTAEEVTDWLKRLLHNLAYLKAADANAGIKVDVNVNIPGKTQRVEIKNISSLDNIGQAINYELERQALEGGKQQETRRFDEVKGKTIVMRTKEGADDYRFLQEVDLQHLVLGDEFVNSQKERIPESPEKKVEKLIAQHKIDKYHADILTKNLEIVEFFEKVAQRIDAHFALPWVTVELLRLLNYHKTTLSAVNIKVEHFVTLLSLVKEGKITPLKAKEILNQFYPTSFAPSAAAGGKITDEKEIEKVAHSVIKENAQAAADYKAGEQKALDFLMGKIMAATQKRADFAIARKVLQKILAK